MDSTSTFYFNRQKATYARSASTMFYKGSHRLDSAWYGYGG